MALVGTFGKTNVIRIVKRQVRVSGTANYFHVQYLTTFEPEHHNNGVGKPKREQLRGCLENAVTRGSLRVAAVQVMVLAVVGPETTTYKSTCTPA